MIANRQNLNDLFTAYNAAFKEGFGMAGDDWQKIAMLAKSNTDNSLYAWLGNSSGMRKWLGERVIESLASYDYRIINEQWENTVSVPRNAIEDDQYGVYTPLLAEMGRSLVAHKNELVFGLLKKGFETKCYDGQYFFDTDHPVEDSKGASSSVNNTGGGSASAWYLLDTSRMIKPIIFQERQAGKLMRKDREEDDNVFMRNEYIYGVDCRNNVGYGLWQLAYGSKQDLTATNYASARAAMLGVKNRGRPMGIKPNLLVVPPTLESKARKLVVSTLAGGGETNEWAGSAELLVSTWLA